MSVVATPSELENRLEWLYRRVKHRLGVIVRKALAHLPLYLGEDLRYEYKRERQPPWEPVRSTVKFSVITCVYEKSPADHFRLTAASLRVQSYAAYEWVVLAQGPIPEDLQQALDEAQREDPRCRVIRLQENRGIVPGMRKCVEESRGQYVLPLDGDDLLTPHCLLAFVGAIEANGHPGLVFSDEDVVEGDVCRNPYYRPGWDPVLNLSCSYAWHAMAWHREKALTLGVYDDPASNWCQDWDTIMRFYQAGERIVHVPRVLYHWRFHASSSTNTTEPEKRSLDSQRHILERTLKAKCLEKTFAVEDFPVWRGSKEWWLRYTGKSYGTWAIVTGSEALYTLPIPKKDLQISRVRDPRQAGDLLSAVPPDTDWVLISADGVMPEGEHWLDEVMALSYLHADVGLISPRILSRERKIVAGGALFGWNHDLVGRPFLGWKDDHAGPYALALKHRTADTVPSCFFIARGACLDKLKRHIPKDLALADLGVWLGAMARETGWRVAVSPLINGYCAGRTSAPWMPPLDDPMMDTDRFRHRFPVPDLMRGERWFALVSAY